MSKMLTQVIYDLQKNTKLSIYTETNDRGTSSVTYDGGSISSIGGAGGGMIKFYPVGSSEELTYEVEKLTNAIPSLPSDNINYVGFEAEFPTSHVYSLLNDNVMYKPFEYDSSKIILGTMPNIVSIMYSAVSEITLPQQFGVVCADKYYNLKYDEVSSSLAFDGSYSLRSCSTLNSISNNKSQQKVTVYATGQVLCEWEPYIGGTNDAYVQGIQYISRGFDVDYYNQTIIPITISSVINNVQHAPVQNPITESDGEGGYTTKSFTTQIESWSTQDYLYYGEDPLQIKMTNSTYMESESLVDLENFLVLGLLDKTGGFQRAFIANKGLGTHRCHYTEYDYNNYDTFEHDHATFYRLTSTVKARWEDCLIGTVNDITVLYPCTRGASSQSGLSTMISYLSSTERETLIEDAPEISDAQAESYYTKLGVDMVKVQELIAFEGSLVILNNKIKVKVNRERLERSITRCVPLGRNMSHRALFSERVGEITQDFDSKEFVGGALPFKTKTLPTYPARATAGSGANPQNVGYGNAVYYSDSDVQTIADNFAAINDNLSNVNISFKGKASIDDLEAVMNDDFILDTVTWDIGRNATTFTCRAVLFN